MNRQCFTYNEIFELESGAILPRLEIAYHTYGTLNATKSNVVWVFHALTANSDVMEWWPGLFGVHDTFNPNDHFIICVNVLGSPYGSTAPLDLNFPQFTVRDVMKVQLLLANYLEIEKIHVLVGGSFGGSQALEFATMFDGKVDHIVVIACAAQESAWAIAIHETQRMALQADCTFGKPNGGAKGLEAARGIGMLTYRTPDSFIKHQTDDDERIDNFNASSYVRYQGKKLSDRFNALSYYYLGKCLDSHDLGRGRGGSKNALNSIKIKTLIIGIDSDILLPTPLQRYIADNLQNGVYQEITSEYGHDGFLIETKQISELIETFIQE